LENGMKSQDERRAIRLLRWYPVSWRSRYGEEFLDHLEQEFADRSVDFRRTLNIAYNGLVARVADVGLLSCEVNVESQTRAAVGTTFVLSAMVTFIALDFWSRAMLAWNGTSLSSIPDSITTGVLTVATGLLVVVLWVIVLMVAYCIVRQIISGRARGLVVPSVFAMGSGGFLLYVARFFPMGVARYVHGAAGFSGIRFSNPGQVINALAQITWDVTQSWIGPWHQGQPRIPIMQTVMNDCVPIAVMVFSVALALLVRRVEAPRKVVGLGSKSVALLWTLISVFIVTYFIWSSVGGPSHDEYFFPESAWFGVTYLVFIALAAVVVARAGLIGRSISRIATMKPQGND
jgi:hypothetical protein